MATSIDKERCWSQPACSFPIPCDPDHGMSLHFVVCVNDFLREGNQTMVMVGGRVH